jgi:L-2,4-diaminobutyrate transaminase
MKRERLSERAREMGEHLHTRLKSAFADMPNAGDIRGGKGLLAAVEFVADRATKANLASHLKFAGRLKAEMMARGVVTRVRPAAGAHPLPGDIVLFAPPLVISEVEIDRVVSVAQDAVHAVLTTVSA